jgi:hypothetical protein
VHVWERIKILFLDLETTEVRNDYAGADQQRFNRQIDRPPVIHLSKLQRLQNKFLGTTGKFPRCTLARELHMALQVPYVYDYVTKLCRKQAEGLQSHGNANFLAIAKGEARHRKYKPKLGCCQAYNRSGH